MKKLIFVTALISTTSLFSQKYGMSNEFDLPEGLPEGSVAPEFSGRDQNGNVVELKKLRQNGPVVLMFYRGYWCGHCNRQLGAFQESLDKVLEKGASVIAVTPENNDGIEKTIDKNDITFSVLSDQDYSIMDSYDVRFLVTSKYNNKIKTFKGIGIGNNNSDEKPYLPVPATYIIGMDGNIKKAWFDEDYSERPSIAEIIEHL